jgi:membrane fusion protein, adhesin transport system
VVSRTPRTTLDRIPRSEIPAPIPDGSTLIEARVGAGDIAFIGAGQRATVKLTAYDFEIAAALACRVERVGTSAVIDHGTGETYYPIAVRPDQKDGSLSGAPGAVTIDIDVGHRTIQAALSPQWYTSVRLRER